MIMFVHEQLNINKEYNYSNYLSFETFDRLQI
jgi:hypothetical protein